MIGAVRYLSVCSGIEAASLAFQPLGWAPVAFSEIEPFPCAVLAHHYPTTPNWGDLTRFREWPDAAIDLLIGGTPCQSFSVAGLRKGLDDPRGNLALTYLAVLDRYRPTWCVWENVPGVLSSNGGRDFGAFIGGLGELGYGFAWAVLDAQWFGVPQRRRRVFLVGHSGGDWRRAAAVLVERESLCGHPAPRREAGQDVAGSLEAGAGRRRHDEQGTDFDGDGGLISSTGAVSHCLNAGGMGRQDYETETLIAHAFDARQSDVIQYGDQSGPLDTDGHSIGVMAFAERGTNVSVDGDCAATLKAACNNTGGRLAVQHAMSVRRLTPRECERLQGVPDDFTLIPYRGKPAADGNRYKALGNSMAVPVVQWIGRRVAQVDPL